MEASLVTSVTTSATATKPASATPAASASHRPPVSAEGQPPASATNPPASATNPPVLASTDSRPPASTGVRPSQPGDRHPPLPADSRSVQAGHAREGGSSRRREEQTRDSRRSVRWETNRPGPRVLVFTSEEKRLASLSPFQRREGCDRFGEVRRCVKLRDGGLEVEFADEGEARRAMSITSFTYTVRTGGTKRKETVGISVAAHRTKNSSKGVINCFDLSDTTDDEIVDGLADQGVTDAYRIKSRREGQTIYTNNIILTFDSTDLPSYVTVGYVRVKVRPYVPNPMRCFACQRFGHTRTYCRAKPVCGRCASLEHLSEQCEAAEPRCVNCGPNQVPHASFDRNCPSFLKEKEVVALKALNNISFREARELYETTHPKVTYAEKVSTQKASDRSKDISLTELATLLRAFGLTVVPASAPVPPETSRIPEATERPAPPAKASAARPELSAPPPPNEAENEGWTLVGKRGTRQPSLPVGGATPNTPAPHIPSPSAPGRPLGETVREALHRGETERRAREAKRARLVERARESRRPSSSDATLGPSSKENGDIAPSTTSAATPTMGPPPPPPPPPRLRGLSSPQPSGPSSEAPPAETPPSTPAPLEPPPAPGRPPKRVMPCGGSPTEGGSPRTRHKHQASPRGGRASSADGRLSRSSLHPRVQFGGTGASSDKGERF